MSDDPSEIYSFDKPIDDDDPTDQSLRPAFKGHAGTTPDKTQSKLVAVKSDVGHDAELFTQRVADDRFLDQLLGERAEELMRGHGQSLARGSGTR